MHAVSRAVAPDPAGWGTRTPSSGRSTATPSSVRPSWRSGSSTASRPSTHSRRKSTPSATAGPVSVPSSHPLRSPGDRRAGSRSHASTCARISGTCGLRRPAISGPCSTWPSRWRARPSIRPGRCGRWCRWTAWPGAGRPWSSRSTTRSSTASAVCRSSGASSTRTATSPPRLAKPPQPIQPHRPRRDTPARQPSRPPSGARGPFRAPWPARHIGWPARCGRRRATRAGRSPTGSGRSPTRRHWSRRPRRPCRR